MATRGLIIYAIVMLLHLCAGQEPISYSIVEEERPGSVLGNLISDADLDQTIGFAEANRLKFRFLSTPDKDKNFIKVDEDTGIVKVNARIDREEICPLQEDCRLDYDVVVSPREYFTIIKITLIIVDLNDHAPTFPESEITLRIPESTLSGTTFPIAAAQDLDGGDNGIQKYELDSDTQKVFGLQVRSNANGRFDLRIQLLEYLDREEIDGYDLRIIARDGGSPPRQGILIVHVKVDDSNDNDPQFDPMDYELEIVESIPVGTSITRVHAVDRDIGQNGHIRYSFSSQTREDYGDVFGINDQTGDVFVRGPLDFEQRNLYVLTVIARDRGEGPLTSQAEVIVHIKDVNDKPPTVSINTISESGMPEILENAQPHTFVAHLTVVDNDQGRGGLFNCTIRNDNFEMKSIAQDQYSIFSLRTFDRELVPEYTIHIVCTDFGNPPLRSLTKMQVRVVDVNDHDPKFIPTSFHKQIIENQPPGAKLIKINATDADEGLNSRLLYSLSGTNAEQVSIDAHSGVVSTRNLLDHERFRELNFIVHVEDRGMPPRSARASVRIEVLDEDDEWPQFEHEEYTFNVAENQAPGAIVGAVIANDADSYPFNDFEYALERHHSSGNFFQIDDKTGTISTIDMLDRETASIYTLTAIAIPHGGNRNQASECHVVIHVGDLNDNKPVFQFPIINYNDTVQISSQTPAGQTIAILRAHDADKNHNADLMYAIVGGNDGNTFSIDSSNGHVLLYKDVSHISDRQFRLTVEVKDKGDPQLSDVSTLFVTIINSSVLAESGTAPHGLLQSEALTIILAITAGALLVLIIVACAVILVCRARKRRKQDEMDSKECQKMLQYNGTTSRDPSPSPAQTTVPNGNGVTVIDMRNEKNYKPVLDGVPDTEKTPLTVDLLSNHPIVKQNGIPHQNGGVHKFSTFGHQHNGSSNHRNQNHNKHHGNNQNHNGFHDQKQYSRTLSPQRNYANGMNGVNHHAYGGNKNSTTKVVRFPNKDRNSTLSGEYTPYDLVDSDV